MRTPAFVRSLWYTALLLVVVVAALVVACGGGNSASDAGAATAPESAAIAPPAATPVATPSAAPPAAEPAPEPSTEPAPEPVEEAAVSAEPLSTPQPYDNTYALEVLRTLAVEIGPRVQGTEAEAAAADYLQSQFEAFGYEVEQQSVPIATFDPGTVEVRINGEALEAHLLVGSAGGSVQGRVIPIPGLGGPADYADLDVQGAVALVERGVLFFQEKVEVATEQGAAAIIIYNNEPGAFDGFLESPSAIPALTLDQASGVALAEAANAGPVTAKIVVTGGAGTSRSQNVIARTAGGECRVWVGGHYDSVPEVPGANDNASGTSLVVALARAFAGSAGARYVCFVAFGAEEASAASGGIQGSDFLTQTLQETGEVGTARVMLNLDVAGSGRGLLLVGDADLVALARPPAEAVGLPVIGTALPQNAGSDHLSFQAIGVPVIFPTMEGGPLHTADDTFDNIDPLTVERMGRLSHALLRCLIAQASDGEIPVEGCSVTPE